MRRSLVFSIPNDITMIAPASVRMCEFASRNTLRPRECYRFNVAVDELLSNIIKYAFHDGQTHYIAIRVDILPDRVELTIRDDGIPFDLTAYPEPELSTTLEERATGGLGIHLVRKLMHSISYEYTCGQNVVHLVYFRDPTGLHASALDPV